MTAAGQLGLVCFLGGMAAGFAVLAVDAWLARRRAAGPKRVGSLTTIGEGRGG